MRFNKLMHLVYTSYFAVSEDSDDWNSQVLDVLFERWTNSSCYLL